jgi:hypothetical protein
MRRAVIDANLLLLIIVGNVRRSYITEFKRTTQFDPESYDLLVRVLGEFDEWIATPNSLTEVSNLLKKGPVEPLRSKLRDEFISIVEQICEIYVPSSVVVAAQEFRHLGLADTGQLEVLGENSELLSVDAVACAAAWERGLRATNFNHLREQEGLV